MAKQTLPKKAEKTDHYVSELSISAGKMPPNAVEFEKLVIGTLLIDRKGVDEATYVLGSNFQIFYDPRLSLIYEVIYDLNNRKIPVDLMTVIQELKRREKLGEAGGDHFIIDLTMGVSSSAHLEYHLRVVMEKYFLRTMINQCAYTIDFSYKESTDVFDMLDGLRNTVIDLETMILQTKENVNTLTAHSQMIENYRRNEPPTVPINYKQLKSNLDGFYEGDVVVVGARPSIGKTAVALNFGINAAMQGVKTAIFCLEMSSLQMHQRTSANVCDVSFYRLTRKLLWETEMQNLYTAGDLEKMPLEYDETKNLFQILSRIRVMAKKGFKFFIIDYIQIITTEGMKFGTRENEIAFISRALKSIAKELKIVIMPLAQTSRESEKRPSKRPVISDLRESGAIEADADIVCLIHRPEFYGIKEWDCEWDGQKGLPTEGEIELQFAKYRNGSPFNARMKFWGDRMRISDLDAIHQEFSNPQRTYNGQNELGEKDEDGDFDSF